MDDSSTSRLRRIIGDEGMSVLVSSYVAVFGLGGVGSSCAEALARSGIGSFLFVDRDAVEPSNINRQAIAFVSTVGKRKASVMEAMALDINPDARIVATDAFLTADNLPSIVEQSNSKLDLPKPDYVVDALDTLTVKASIMQYCEGMGISCVSAMGGANKVDPSKLEFAKLENTHVCPLCRDMRKIARQRGISNVDVLFSSEKPVLPPKESREDRRERTELGTMSYMPPIMGQMLAGFVIRKLLGDIII